ncbi:preprotein translocase subunit TatA [Candidatus Methylomirabilis lanthanidiphila]|uniref:Sec-independent protein translocase protein TatC n=1 Tax=Candidatus Methylomirabilis lanthanidiphila TaxID=2211376 RepID=A0A564ZLP7_9BACT|nr:twin-arginine translocase subunit TatC [Candidatus Methylomirabilis lanthanidiphila]VUZ86259.1 preprotein translocase subunit TatA [Candidatus Methylomirabilis lanthanidiphila]
MSDEKMSFVSHLEELRKRIIVCLAAIGVGFVITFNYSETILHLLKRPLTTDLIFARTYPFLRSVPRTGPPIDLIFLAPAEAFWMHMKIALVTGLLLTLPIVLYQIWRFIAPGLLSHEKRYALPFVVLSTIFFVCGVAFCFYFVLPFSLNFLLTYKTENLKPMISIGNYIDFTTKFLLAFGLVFELPLAIGIAAKMGLVTPQYLSRNRKYAILIAFTVAAILTPTPDVFNQTLMALPMYLLYEIGILAARMLVRRTAAASQEATEGV